MTTHLIDGPKGSIVLVECDHRLDATNAKDLKEIQAEHTRAGHYRFVIDLGATEFVDSSGLGALVARISDVKTNRGGVHLTGVRPQIEKLLEMTQLVRILEIYDNRQAAIAGFATSV